MKRNLKEQAECRDQLTAGHPDVRGLRLGISDLVAEAVLLLHEETLRRIEADKYRQFLESKAPIAIDRGISGKFTMKGDLRPHAKDIAAWMIRGGNRACFASFGLHKTSIQLQVCNSLLDADKTHIALIVCPLGVRREFTKESVERGFKRTPIYFSSDAQLQALRAKGERLFITNYERVRDGGLNVRQFQIVTLDEASVLKYSRGKVYDFAEHVRIAEEMEKRGILPSSFMALEVPNPGSPHVWDDVTRMRTLNGEQARKGWEQHVCPLQLDIVERLIERYSNPGEVVCDMFGGIGTVAYSAILKGRKAYTIELNPDYHRDALSYCRGAEQKVSMPTLFSFLENPDDE